MLAKLRLTSEYNKNKWNIKSLKISRHQLWMDSPVSDPFLHHSLFPMQTLLLLSLPHLNVYLNISPWEDPQPGVNRHCSFLLFFCGGSITSKQLGPVDLNQWTERCSADLEGTALRWWIVWFTTTLPSCIIWSLIKTLIWIIAAVMSYGNKYAMKRAPGWTHWDSKSTRWSKKGLKFAKFVLSTLRSTGLCEFHSC